MVRTPSSLITRLSLLPNTPVTRAINALSLTAKRTYAVLGNHDEIDTDKLPAEITILDTDVKRTDSFTIGGVSGVVGNPRKNNRKTEADFLAAIDKCSGSPTDVLLLHQGPRGSNDEDPGLESVNQQLRKRSNLLVLFGHCHWSQPFSSEGQNLFCNVDGRVVAFIPDEDT